MARKSPDEHIEELKAIARRRGGRVLSRAYLGDAVKLPFQCAEAHVWLATPGKIKQDRWCPTCGRRRVGAKRRAAAEGRLKRLVARRGGAILTPYVTSQEKTRFRCELGHEWSAVPSSVLMGTWCPTCADASRGEERREKVQKRLTRLVERRGGAILSPFEGTNRRLLVRCGEGHQWRIRPRGLELGTWCPSCKEDAWLEEVRAKAREQGGRCLSRRCRGWEEEVLLECRLGHRWRTLASQVKRGQWCPTCRLAQAHDLERMRAAARERGGECLSEEYVDSATPLRWRCGQGHEWEARPQSVLQGHWCDACSRGFGRSRRRLDIETMHRMARERGGACLSKRYSGIYSCLRWRCARGHEWTSAANNVRRGGWCPRCSHGTPGTLERMRELAAARGGRCLSRSWNDHRKPLLFACAAGHRFRLNAGVVKTGVWCPECPRGRHANRPRSLSR